MLLLSQCQVTTVHCRVVSTSTRHTHRAAVGSCFSMFHSSSLLPSLTFYKLIVSVLNARADINVLHLIKSEAACQKKTMTMEFQKNSEGVTVVSMHGHLRSH